MIKMLRIGLVLALILSLHVSAFAAAAGSEPSKGDNFADVKRHWAKASIDRWSAFGVLKGGKDGWFRPNDGMTRAEFATVINRLFGFRTLSNVGFRDVPENAWYAGSMRIAGEAGYFDGFPNGEARPLERISRQEAATVLARAFSLTPRSGEAFSEGFKDAGQIALNAREAVNAMKGLLRGYPSGEFGPDRPLTRAEAVTLVDQLVGAYFPSGGTYTGLTTSAHAIVNAPGVVLRKIIVSGNLYLTPGIGDGDAELNRIEVEGTVFAYGGGQPTIRIRNSSLPNVVVHRDSVIELGQGTTVGLLTLGPNTELTLHEGSSVTKLIVVADSTFINGKQVAKGEYTVTGGQIAATGNPASSGGGGAGSGGGGGGSSGGGSAGGNGTLPVVRLVDRNATAETRSLFLYLNDIRGKRLLFGHQHATDEGLTLVPMASGLQSEVKNSVGDFPAVFGWDTLSLEGKEKPGVAGNPEQSRANLAESVKAAHRIGGIITLSAHMPNFATGGMYNDTSGSAVERILPGGDKNEAYNAFLDNIALFASQAKDDNGKPIPILFRPFHEQNGGWFWWGAKTTSTSQYVEIYRYTVEYLRDRRGVNNFLYVYSPNGTFGGDENVYLTTYPGDGYVDILGMDQYDNLQTPGTAGFLDNLVSDLKMISKLADSKGKIAVFSEFGYSPSGMRTTGNADLQWFTRLLNAIKSDPDAKRIAYMQTWANFGLDNNLFVPYKNAPDGLGDHELLPDFIAFYNDPYTAFLDDVRGVYGRPSTTAPQAPFLHVASPTDGGAVKEAATKIRARVLNATPVKVAYSVGGSNDEIPMALDSEGFYYEADWSPSASLNGKLVTLTVKAYWPDGSTMQQTVSASVKVGEILMKAYPFESGIEGIQNNGTYPSSIGLALSHAAFDGGKALRMTVNNAVQADTWQELKLEFQGLSNDVAIADVRRIKLDAWIPLSAGDQSANASIRAIAMLPGDWETKYGMTTTYSKLTDLPTVKIGDTVYAKFSPVIDLDDPAKSATATGLAISLVGGELDLDGDVYLDNIRLYSVYAETPQDPALVDDFESYQGSDAELAKKFLHAGGDRTTVALDESHKSGGNYALKFGYTLGGSGYAGITKSLGGVDWSGFNRLKFWLVPDGSNQKLVIQIKIDGVSFEAYPSLAGTEAEWVDLHFGEFSVAPWDTGNTGKKITKSALRNVQEMSIYVNSVGGATLSGSLYLDDIKAFDDGSGGVPNGGGGSGGTPAPSGTLYGFETDTAGWKIEQNDAAAGAPVMSSDAASEGEHSLAASFSLEGTSFELTKVGALDLSEATELRAKVKLSTGQANVRLYIKTGSDWTWYDSGAPILVDSGGFATLSLALSGVSHLDKVQSIGLKLESFSGTGMSVLYLDDVYVVGRGSGE